MGIESAFMSRLNHHGTVIISFMLFFTFLPVSAPVSAESFGNGGVHVRGYDNHDINSGDGKLYSDERGGKGNGATGVVAALLLVLANVTVLISLIAKGINRYFASSPETRESISAFNQGQKRYLKGLHYFLNPIAICMAVIHFHLSACRSILPDTALILFIIIGVLGVVMKYQLCNKNYIRIAYRLHCSWIAFSIVFLVLIIGHGVI